MYKVKISVKNTTVAIGLFLVYYESFMCSLPLISASMRMFAAVFGLALLLLSCPLKPIARGKNAVSLGLGFVMILFVLIGLLSYKETLSANIRFIVLIIAYFFTIRNQKWQRIYINMMYIASLFFVITTIWLKYDLNSYFKFFANNMYPTANFNFSRGVAKGITAGVCNHYSHNGIMLGNAMSLLFPFMIIYGKEKKSHYVALTLNIIAMVLCGKRAQVVFPILACIIAWMVYSRINAKTLLKCLAAVFLFILLVVFLYRVSPALQNYILRYSNMSSDGNILSRYQYWEIAISHFMENPIFGNGWLSFRSFNTNAQDAHNNYIQLLCDVGIVGTIIFLMFFISNLAAAVKNMKYISMNKSTIKKQTSVYCMFALVNQIYFLLYALTGNPLQLLYSFCPYIASCAIGQYYYCLIKR